MKRYNKKRRLIDEFWLEEPDDVLRQRLKQTQETIKQETVQKKVPSEPKTVTVKIPRVKIPDQVTISVPKADDFTKFARKLRLDKAYRFATRHKGYSIVVCIVLFIVIVSGLIVLSKGNSATSSGHTTAKAKPDFNPVVPLRKKEGGSNNLGVRFSPNNKSASIQDNYFGKTITLSQQQLSAAAAKDPVTLVKASTAIAQAFNLSITDRQSVTTSQGEFYYFNMPKTTEQRGVLVYNNLLIFFIANKQLQPDEWQQYIKELTTAN